MRAFIKLPDYFKTHKHEGLFDLTNPPYAYACGLEGLTYYETISHDPDRFNMFNMTLTQTVPVLRMFPFSSMRNNKSKPKQKDHSSSTSAVVEAKVS